MCAVCGRRNIDMPLDKEQNKERMKHNRAAQKHEEQEAIIDAIVAKLSDKLPDILLTIVSDNVQLNNQRKMSCREEAAHPVPHTPPLAIVTGGTRGRSPAMGSGNGRKKAGKHEARTPPTPPKSPTPPKAPTPPTPLTPVSPLPPLSLPVSFTPPMTPLRTPPSPLSPLSPLSFFSELERSTPGAKLSAGPSTAKELVSDLIDMIDDVHKIFTFPKEEDDFMAEKKRYYK
jgi:hypothetical protein